MPGSNRLSIVERIDYILCWPCAAKPCHSHILFFVEEPGGLFGAVFFSMPEASQRTVLLFSFVTREVSPVDILESWQFHPISQRSVSVALNV